MDGGNGGTWAEPVEDNTTTVYDPENVPEGTTLYTNIAGEPKVTADSNGNITRFEYTDTGTGVPVPTGGLDTGILAFDGSDFDITLKATYTFSEFPASGISPIINISVYDTTTNKVSGFLFGGIKNYGGTTYNENGDKISSSSSNQYLKYRFVKYNEGSSTGSVDYYHKNGTTAFYTARFGTQSTTFTITTKIHCRSGVFTSEIEVNDEIIAKPRYTSSSATQDTTFTLSNASIENATIELGKWTNTGGNPASLDFDILEFSVVKQ